MKYYRLIAILLLSFNCYAQQLSEKDFAELEEVNHRISANGMSYQMVKRCDANAETLKKLKAYLYKDVAKSRLQYPDVKANLNGLFEFSAKAGDEFYESRKNNPNFCKGLIEQATKYISE